VRPSDFEALSIRAAALETARPRLYRVLVIACIWAGRLVLAAAVVAALVLGTLALLTPFTWAFAALAAVFAWQVARSIVIDAGRMRGIRIPRHHAIELHRMLEGVAARMGVAPVDDVYLTGELNAGVREIPLLGELGVSRTEAQVGLAMLQALTADELRAVLAHELAHLSGGHARFAARVACERERWLRLDARLREQRHPLTRVVAPLVGWYLPRLDALTQVLVRDHELEADRRSAEIVGARVAADAVMRVAILERLVSARHREPILARAVETPEPVGEPHAWLPAFLASLEEGDIEREMRAALGSVAQPESSHPALAERLDAMGAASRLPPRVETSAAAMLVDEAFQRRLERVFDEHWRRSVARDWRERHERAARTASLLHALHARASHGALPADDLARRAALVFDADGEEAARPLVGELRERHPDSAGALLLGGRLRLADGDDGGLDDVRRAMTLDPRLTLGACGLAAAFLEGAGRRDDAASWLRLGKERAHAEEMARGERERVPTQPEAFEACGLSQHAQLLVRERLGSIGGLRLCVLLKRRLEWLPEEPAWLLFAARSARPFESRSVLHDQALIAELSRERCLPRPTWVVVLAPCEAVLAESLARVPGALVVRSRRWPLLSPSRGSRTAAARDKLRA